MSNSKVATNKELGNHEEMILFTSPIDRMNLVGGTTASIIMGQNPWNTVKQLDDYYLEGIQYFNPNRFAEWGLRLEDVVGIKYAEGKDGLVIDPVAIADAGCLPGHQVIDQKQPWLVGSPDRLFVPSPNRHSLHPCPKELRLEMAPRSAEAFFLSGVGYGVEIKTSYYFSKRKWEKQGVPINYQIQCQFYMAITGLKRWDLAIYHGGTAEYDEYRLEADPLQIMDIRKQCADYVQKIKKLRAENGYDNKNETVPAPAKTGADGVSGGNN